MRRLYQNENAEIEKSRRKLNDSQAKALLRQFTPCSGAPMLGFWSSYLTELYGRPQQSKKRGCNRALEEQLPLNLELREILGRVIGAKAK